MRARRDLPKARPFIPDEDVDALLDDFSTILRGGQLTRGPYLERFERQFAASVGVRHAVGLSSGTAPLEIALRCWGVKRGEVIVPTNTFVASANAALLAGGIPVLADIDPATLSSGLREIREEFTDRTRAVIVVHVAGLIPSDIDDIRDFCRQRELFLLEDAAHAHGAALGGRRAGSLGDAAGFSFFPTKVITSGEGGMLTTDDAQLADFARSFRCHGIASEGRSLVRLGTNLRMPELSAALGLRQLGRLEEFVRQRQRLAGLYGERLQQIPGIGLFLAGCGRQHPYYKFPVLLPAGSNRQRILAGLQQDYGIIGGSVYWPPVHLEPFYRERFGYGEGSFPVAEEVLQRTITLPLFVEMDEGDIDYVCDALRDML